MPSAIRLKKGHSRVGTILRKYEGKSYTIEPLPNTYDTINDGDYIGFRCHMTQEYLEKNPDMWEPA
jgi:hypothetical protein